MNHFLDTKPKVNRIENERRLTPQHRGNAGSGCDGRYDLRVHWRPTGGSMVIAVTQYDTAILADVTENITLQWNSTAAQAKTAIELHSVYVAESLTADCEHGPFPSSNMLVKLAAGGTMQIVSDTLVRATAAPVPEFRVDKCCLR